MSQKDLKDSSIPTNEVDIKEEEFSEFAESSGLLRQKAKEIYQKLDVDGDLASLEKLLKDSLPDYFKMSQSKFQDKAECRRVMLDRAKKDPSLNSILEMNLQRAEQLLSDASVSLTEQLVSQFKEQQSSKAGDNVTSTLVTPIASITPSTPSTPIKSQTPTPKEEAPAKEVSMVESKEPDEPKKSPKSHELEEGTIHIVPESKDSQPIKKQRTEQSVSSFEQFKIGKKVAGFVTSNKGKIACIQVVIEECTDDGRYRVGDAEAKSQAKKKCWTVKKEQIVDYEDLDTMSMVQEGTPVMSLYPIDDMMSSVFYRGLVKQMLSDGILVAYEGEEEVVKVGPKDFFPISEIRDSKLQNIA